MRPLRPPRGKRLLEPVWLADLAMREVWVAGPRLREHLAGDPSDSNGGEALNTAWSVLREM